VPLNVAERQAASAHHHAGEPLDAEVLQDVAEDRRVGASGAAAGWAAASVPPAGSDRGCGLVAVEAFAVDRGGASAPVGARLTGPVVGGPAVE
jgi:hypothetical protein